MQDDTYTEPPYTWGISWYINQEWEYQVYDEIEQIYVKVGEVSVGDNGVLLLTDDAGNVAPLQLHHCNRLVLNVVSDPYWLQEDGILAQGLYGQFVKVLRVHQWNEDADMAPFTPIALPFD
jgi:hypothetical protein